MHVFPKATTRSTRHRRRWGRIVRTVPPVAIAAAVTATIALTGNNIDRAAVKLTGVEIVPGVSVTPAPGWVVGFQGPGGILLHNLFSTAVMEIRIKPADGTDPVAVLQNDVNTLVPTSATGLTNVKNLTAPTTKPLPGPNFQQEASIDYSADASSQMGPAPVVGAFIELLNTANRQSAFIIFVQDGGATTHVDADGGAMIDSLA